MIWTAQSKAQGEVDAVSISDIICTGSAVQHGTLVQ